MTLTHVSLLTSCNLKLALPFDGLMVRLRSITGRHSSPQQCVKVQCACMQKVLTSVMTVTRAATALQLMYTPCGSECTALCTKGPIPCRYTHGNSSMYAENVSAALIGVSVSAPV
jgi:hypothetical protein